MTVKTISELVQPAISVLRECLFSVRIALPATRSLLARSRRLAHEAQGLYRLKLRGGLCASRIARAINGAGLPCLATCSCFLRIPYPTGWVFRIESTRTEYSNLEFEVT